MIFRHDRASRGGGVLVAIRESIHVERLQVPDGIEILSLKLHLDKILILSTVYIQPNSDLGHYQIVLNHFSDVLKFSHDCVFVGDFNLPDIIWSTLASSSSISQYYCDFIFDNNLIQYVESPTHVKGNILDLIISNSFNLIDNISINCSHKSLSSDHFMISFEISLHNTLSLPTNETLYAKLISPVCPCFSLIVISLIVTHLMTLNTYGPPFRRKFLKL